MALRSDHVVRVFDLGVLPSNTPYMVLEYLEGTDLRALLETRGALPVEVAVDYVLQVCEALAEAHLNGIVHRDLKPQNLFLTRRANGTPCIKLLDFGVSKFAARSDSKDELTMSHVLLGSPVYMSPEQIRDSRKVDARADVWSLGVVLYMLLGGGRPFTGEGLAGTCASIMVDAPSPLSARCPAVPEALEAIVFACLEKSRERRTQDVAELAGQLMTFASAAGRVSAERVIHVYASSPPRPRSSQSPAEAAPTSAARAASGSGDATAVDSSRRSVAHDATAVDGTSFDGEMPAFAPAATDGPPPAGPLAGRRARTVAAALVAAALFVAIGLAWMRLGVAPGEAVRTAAPPSGLASDNGAPDKDKKEPAPRSEGESAEVGGASAAAAQAPSASSARRPPGGRAPAARPPVAGSARRKGQVDRNGVPILD
jgi:serine/threonine-protein kinase